MTLIHPASIALSVTQVQSNYAKDWQTIAQDWRWFFFLVVIGSFSCAINSHPPLVCFAVLAGTTLTWQRATLAGLAIWLASQIFGYGLHGYPHLVETFVWEAIVGFSVFLTIILAAIRPKFSRTSMPNQFLWMSLALIGNFLLFEGLFVMFWIVFGGHGLTLPVLWQLFLQQVIWMGTITAGHGYLMQRNNQR